MTFYYDNERDELVGNNMFTEDLNYGPLAERDSDTLRVDVTEIMENGRGLRKLREIEGAVQSAIEAHDDT